MVEKSLKEDKGVEEEKEESKGEEVFIQASRGPNDIDEDDIPSFSYQCKRMAHNERSTNAKL